MPHLEVESVRTEQPSYGWNKKLMRRARTWRVRDSDVYRSPNPALNPNWRYCRSGTTVIAAAAAGYHWQQGVWHRGGREVRTLENQYNERQGLWDSRGRHGLCDSRWAGGLDLGLTLGGRPEYRSHESGGHADPAARRAHRPGRQTYADVIRKASDGMSG